MPRTKASPVVLKNGAAWKTFYHGPGRPALAALFSEFGLYGVSPPGLTGEEAIRREGQRDVLLRIVQMIGLREEAVPTDAWDDTDILDRMIGTHR